jgi:hypothetical protein
MAWYIPGEPILAAAAVPAKKPDAISAVKHPSKTDRILIAVPLVMLNFISDLHTFLPNGKMPVCSMTTPFDGWW